MKKLTWLTTLTLSFFMFGCNKSSSSGSSSPAAYTYGANYYGAGTSGCTGCQAGGTPLLVGAQTQYSSMIAAFDILATSGYNSSPYGYGYGASSGYGSYQSNFNSYSGPIIMQGNMVISQAYSFCYAPAGNYSIQSVSQGVASGGVFSGVQLVAVSQAGAQIYMTVYGSVDYASGTRLGLTMVINSVNGQVCNSTLKTY